MSDSAQDKDNSVDSHLDPVDENRSGNIMGWLSFAGQLLPEASNSQ